MPSAVTGCRMSCIDKKRVTDSMNQRLFFEVVPPGIEPGTQGFSVLCSTN